MISIEAKIRTTQGKKTKNLKQAGIVPAVLYGPEVQNIILEVDSKEFKKVFKDAGENTIINLEIAQEKGKKDYSVLVKNVAYDPSSLDPIHIDFYQPNLSKEIEAAIPLEFVGSAPALQMGGTLLKNIQELTVKSLPQNLPHSIEIDINGLKTFEDVILVKNIVLPENVKAVDDLEEVVAKVAEPENTEETSGPTEEDIGSIKKAGDEKKAKKEAEEGGSK
ncbi:MAG: 50S ribosomal protein L25 [Candidatus Pacebacteria bacterium]|nr:50S ribosomal protein L25 [Candidatus Paceibacterota bacterium]